MAIVTAQITVDFTANYAGNHRVCWRVQGSGDPYNCSTLVFCVGGGTACQAIFTTNVNTTSCDGTVTFEGYVQAECEDLASTNGRLPFTVDFVPNVICQRTEVLCARGPIGGFDILDGGSGYTLGDSVVITRDGGDTELGDATVTIGSVGDGVINSITGLISGGSGYVATEVLTIVGSAGAGGTITIDSVDGGGAILTYTLTTNGAGYVGPSFTFTGGSGVGADFDIVHGTDYDDFGEILTFNIPVGGTYGIAPTISITSATGSGFRADVLLDPCPDWNNLGEDCGLNNINHKGQDVGETVVYCLNGGYSGKPDEYEVNEAGCCIPGDTEGTACTDVHIENLTGGPVNVPMVECTTGVYSIVAVPDGGTSSYCVVTGSVQDPGVAGLTITDTGTPCV